jgi:dsRNA-specific ribonuclease
MDCHLPNHPIDDEFTPMMEITLIKVRNIHPTACLHELHVQRRELFPKKPIFDTMRFAGGIQKKRKFAVVCNFEFNSAKLYTYHLEQTKSDAKLNAARAMLRKLKAIPNLTILLDTERTNSGAYASFEHPRCQLLHLHDTNPEMYPSSPIFEANLYRTPSRTRHKNSCFNVTCHFQVGKEKLATIGTANNKNQAVVQAARNMLKQLYPNLEKVKDDQTGSKQAASDRMKSPWKCYLCKIFMTGRKPFLAHLSGRSHIQKMSEQELNVEEENTILLATADEALKKKEEDKRNAALKNCSERVGAQLKSQKNKGFFDSNNVMNTSSQDSQESDGTCKNASTSSSVKSEFETNYSFT